mmetsp:Transcript_89807/g.192566  ORF Transcript_89807/g.192566 Transcript_89807/m.192566 type:complete len:316 (-) Transcript_89807:591-1538(-)
MGTSLAPSPTASVITELSRSLMICTSARFCCGARRQQTQDKLIKASLCSNALASSEAKTDCTRLPSRTRAVPPAGVLFLRLSRFCCKHRTASSVDVQPTKYTISMSGLIRLQERAISTAVSVLSPVSTHMRMPMAFSMAIACGTPSWSRSSIALMPQNFKECSSSAAHTAILCSRSSTPSDLAASNLVRQSSKNLWSSSFQAITKVRSPSLAYESMHCKEDSPIAPPSQREPMTLSAPFVMQRIRPSKCSHTTVMRFRSEEKGTWQITATLMFPAGPSISSTAPELPGVGLRARNAMPTCCVASKKATSSGELPE